MVNEELVCQYSGLPSLRCYMDVPVPKKETSFSEHEIDRIIEMAWEDRTPFAAIEHQFGLKEAEVQEFMKKSLQFGSYKRWRKRVEACSTKQVHKRAKGMNRFKCSRQRAISGNKISKRK